MRLQVGGLGYRCEQVSFVHSISGKRMVRTWLWSCLLQTRAYTMACSFCLECVFGLLICLILTFKQQYMSLLQDHPALKPSMSPSTR